MANTEFIRVERHGALATVTLDRPERNLLTDEVFDELAEKLEALARDEQLAVLLLRGAGADFSRGREPLHPAPANALLHRAELSRIVRANAALQSFPGISIAVVQGRALGAACSLAARCDLTFVADTAKLGFPEINVGLPPAIVIAYIGNLLPRKAAVDLVVTGRELNAAEAKSIGLVSHVVAADRLDQEAQRYADELLSKDHFALRTCKSFFRQLPDLHGATGSEYAITLLATILSSR
jgi:enoyl-CoA hydratase/carnithine racemase